METNQSLGYTFYPFVKDEARMLIGIPKEIKNHEYRVGATPAMVHALVDAGHQVLVQTHAGTVSGFDDESYKASGAKIVSSAKEVYNCEMIIKVKELQESEFPLLKEGQILFCFLHLAPDPIQTEKLIKSKVVAIAYETVTDNNGKLPLLIPMSEIAGRIAIQVGVTYLQLNQGGKGILLGGVPGVPPGLVVVIGGGAAGTEAARMALGLGAEVIILDKDINRLRILDSLYGPRLKTQYSSPLAIEEALIRADLVVGAVLIPGKTAPKLISRQMLKKMSPGTVFVDIAIDQGGCAETSRPTTHTDPVYVVDNIIHYCVTNMPGACARTSSQALTNSTMDYALLIANKGWKQALLENEGLRNGLNVCYGKVTNESVAHDLGYPYLKYEVLKDEV